MNVVVFYLLPALMIVALLAPLWILIDDAINRVKNYEHRISHLEATLETIRGKSEQENSQNLLSQTHIVEPRADDQTKGSIV